MRSINVNQVIDESKFNRFHAMVLFWCAFIIVFDGFDLVVYGSVVPVLMKEWSLTPIQAGTLGSYALFGMMLGALIFGPLADKLGRKNVIMACVAIFSVFTALIGMAQGPTEFGIYRFLAGLGLGGVMPNTVALMTEYSPRKMKSTLVSIMFSGYSVGGMLSAGLGIVLIPRFGWQSVFFVGALPLLSLPLMYKWLPDSPGFLLVRNQQEKMGQLLATIDPAYRPQKNDHYEIVLPKKAGIAVVKLFEKGRALSTVMFWISFFMCLLMVYGLNTWLPKLMAQAGYPLGSSLMFLLVLNLGAIFGAVFGGWAADHWNAKKVLILFYIMAGVSLTLLGFKANTLILYVLVAIAGGATIGTQIIANAYVSQYYPTEMRSTGIGWALGVGRTGAIIGPMMGGVLLTLNLPLHLNFLAFAIPGILAAITIGFVQEKYAALTMVEDPTEKNGSNIDSLAN
ncbi:MFS transporter [Ammoniphilus sp. 3BR4]|uniref:MFS transporter n=1 Tax=Ammoniphilus sp. 3BR4 TaxID=3158265 RepID=UPI003464F970